MPQCDKQLSVPGGRIGLRRGKTAPPRVGAVARRAVGDENHDATAQTPKLRAASDRLIVRVRDYDRDIAYRNDVAPRITDRLEEHARLSAGCLDGFGLRHGNLSLPPR